MQIQLFEKTTAGVNTISSLANSGGILGWPNSHSDWVRPGIMLYGISPFQGEIGKNHQLLPAMTVTSTIIAIRQCRKGDRVGYGGTWVCPENMPVGIIAIGYGDGYPRSLPSGTPVYIEGKLAPTVGTVSMDMIAIDLRMHPTADIGTTVLLWGNELPIEVLAQKANTIAYEIICNINQRLIRNLV
jgi:alanine racemase